MKLLFKFLSILCAVENTSAIGPYFSECL